MRFQDALPSLHPGLVAVTGDERTGKTTLLRRLAGELPDALWLDLWLPDRDAETPRQIWDSLAARCPRWDARLQQDLAEALSLQAHEGKQLFMLSTGGRRKTALAGLLAAGATVTCLDQPYAALDAASIRVVREFLADAAGHASRTWVVADYVADPELPWNQRVLLDE